MMTPLTIGSAWMNSSIGDKPCATALASTTASAPAGSSGTAVGSSTQAPSKAAQRRGQGTPDTSGRPAAGSGGAGVEGQRTGRGGTVPDGPRVGKERGSTGR